MSTPSPISGHSVNLGASLGPMPNGGDVARGTAVGLVIEIEGLLSFTDGMNWALRITKPRYSELGRRLKATPVIILRANKGQSVPDLLREIVRLWEVGEYEFGTPLPIEATNGR